MTTRAIGPKILSDLDAATRREWLEPDGLGGFASGTVSGIRTRRYHALLLVATKPPTERRVLVNGMEEHVVAGGQKIPLSTQRYEPGVVFPQGWRNLRGFSAEPCPTWTWRLPLPDGTSVEIHRRILAVQGRPSVLVGWLVAEGPDVDLEVRPLISGRDYHAVVRRREINANAAVTEKHVSWQPVATLPMIHALHEGEYSHAPDWYMQFQYSIEKERELDFVEDLWSPGKFTLRVKKGKWTYLHLTTEPGGAAPAELVKGELARRAALVPKRLRGSLAGRLHAAADAYIVRRGQGRTIVAGYPWFTDWGRDTCISLRGLCLATGRIADARGILLEWAKTVNEGMLPNRFPDEGEHPEFNSVDASLWFVIAANDYLRQTRFKDVQPLARAISLILDGYSRGTRFGIKTDADGLLSSGQPGVQLTWMDAKCKDVVFTPRMGKPVEIQALWLNALAIAAELKKKKKLTGKLDHAAAYAKGLRSFRKAFWNGEAKCLFDVISLDGKPDPAIRPNQLFAVSLPAALLSRDQAKSVVKTVEKRLLTPMGPRSLDPADPAYHAIYKGTLFERDKAYHNGTIWPWLMGPFLEAYLRAHGRSAKTKNAVRKFIAPLEKHLDDAGLGHISEIADANAPHEPRGCPFQAWSAAELIRVLEMIGG